MSLYTTGMVLVALVIALTIMKHYQKPSKLELASILIVSAVMIPLSWFSLGIIAGWSGATAKIHIIAEEAIREKIKKAKEDASNDRAG